MTKTKSTKRALVSSALALVMCISMLIGSTFAWFTDSVTSSSNKIQSGTLKLDLEMLVKNDDNTTSWKSIKEDKTALFNYTNWEPGYTDVKVLKVENEGSLALKWVAKFVAEKELSALANVIDVYVCPSETEIGFPADRTLAGYTRVGTVAEFVNTIEETTNGTLEAKEVAYLGIALKMQETAGNEYQGLDLGGAFDIQILATQYTFENDSFDNQYDKDAEYLVPVKSSKELSNTLAEGKDVKLTEDIVMSDSLIISGEEKDVTIDLAGKELNITPSSVQSPAIAVTGEGAILNVVNSSNDAVELTFSQTSALVADTGTTINLENVDLVINTYGAETNGISSFMAQNATVNFYSGTITVNESQLSMFNSTFNMYGGKMIVKPSDTPSTNAGVIGIAAYRSRVNLYGGEIVIEGVDSATNVAYGVDMMSTYWPLDGGESVEQKCELFIGKNFSFTLKEEGCSEYRITQGDTDKVIIVDERSN